MTRTSTVDSEITGSAIEGETIKLSCPICHAKTTGSEPMLKHLAVKHQISKRQAKFLTQKLVEWRQGGIDLISFLQNREKKMTC